MFDFSVELLCKCIKSVFQIRFRKQQRACVAVCVAALSVAERILVRFQPVGAESRSEA